MTSRCEDHVLRTIATYDAIAPHYGLTATPALRAWEESSMRLFAGDLPGRRVVVVGCGDGRDSRYLCSLGLDVLSFDLSDGMLAEARRLDPESTYQKLDCREITTLSERFDGAFASGCLYHLQRHEFRQLLADVLMLLNPLGVLYLNLKIGRGEEFRDVPDERYPGGDEARRMLRGPRYYAYYQRSELTSYFIGYDVVRQRDVEHPQEVVEAWLRKPKGDG